MKLYIKIFLLIIIATLIYMLFPREVDRLIYIPSSKDKNIEDAIIYQNIPLNKLDLFVLSFKDRNESWIRLKNGKTNKWILYNKILHPKKIKTRKMVVYGGEILENFTKNIANQAKLNRDKLLKIYRELAYYKEGDILAKKYDIPYNTTEQSTIAYMLYKSRKIYSKIAQNNSIKFPSPKFKKRLIIASIIEKETQNYKEMPLISAVIYNRLKKNMPLQLDATLNYAKNSHKIVTPQMIKTNNSLYNTYKHKGLPPQPICSPSIVALKAAFNPANVNYIYFVKSGRKHIFTKEYKKHLQNVSKYKQALKIKKAREERLIRLINKPIKLKFPTIKPKINIPLPQVGYNFN